MQPDTRKTPTLEMALTRFMAAVQAGEAAPELRLLDPRPESRLLDAVIGRLGEFRQAGVDVQLVIGPRTLGNPALMGRIAAALGEADVSRKVRIAAFAGANGLIPQLGFADQVWSGETDAAARLVSTRPGPADTAFSAFAFVSGMAAPLSARRLHKALAAGERDGRGAWRAWLGLQRRWSRPEIAIA